LRDISIVTVMNWPLKRSPLAVDLKMCKSPAKAQRPPLAARKISDHTTSGDRIMTIQVLDDYI